MCRKFTNKFTKWSKVLQLNSNKYLINNFIKNQLAILENYLNKEINTQNMIEYLASIVLVVAIAAAAYLFLGSFAVFIINILIIGIITARINYDIKKEGILYYIISAFLTAFIFIFRDSFRFIFDLMEKALVLQLSLALIFIFLFFGTTQ